jgi:cell wall-associated NlpC family hydrolase
VRSEVPRGRHGKHGSAGRHRQPPPVRSVPKVVKRAGVAAPVLAVSGAIAAAASQGFLTAPHAHTPSTPAALSNQQALAGGAVAPPSSSHGAASGYAAQRFGHPSLPYVPPAQKRPKHRVAIPSPRPAPTASAGGGSSNTPAPASPVPAGTRAAGGISAAQERSVLSYMEAQVGKPYSTIDRFGPYQFDCSGLVWAALNQAGVPIPADDNVVHSEIEWLAQVPGAKLITNVNDLEPGDIVAMIGADPVETPYGLMGHIGIVASGSGANSVILSAYDTAEGVNETSLAQNNGFAIAVRPQG